MNIEQNTQVAAEFFARFGANDIPGAMAIVADDATWWLAGKRPLLATAGTYSKEEIAKLFGRLMGRLKGSLKMTVKGAIAQGDKVVLEVESYGELTNDRVYNNEYLFLITVRDGKIAAVREYQDTQHVYATFFQQ